MKTYSKSLEIGATYASRYGGHVPQSSNRESSHHITEAIGDLYGDEKFLIQDSRPLISTDSPRMEPVQAKEDSVYDPRLAQRFTSSTTDHGNTINSFTSTVMSDSGVKRNSFDVNRISNSLPRRDDSPSTQFPVNDIDYESDPAEVAQALSNLQALRRMSMDIGSTNDPDLPSFLGASYMPSVAPTGNDQDDDPSRIFWVPARVHPELAPMEFKTFLENRVHSIKRQNGDSLSVTSPSDAFERSGSALNSLRRKKSMLSRQIDQQSSNNNNYDTNHAVDNPGHIESKGFSPTSVLEVNGSSGGGDGVGMGSKDLDVVIRNRSEAMRKLTLDTTSSVVDNSSELQDSANGIEDTPILPQAPGIGLRRSTRTTYRKGSLRKGERVPYSKRAGSLRKDLLGERPDSPIESQELSSHPDDEPVTENFSLPIRDTRRVLNQALKGDILSTKQKLNEEEAIGRVGGSVFRTSTTSSSSSIYNDFHPEVPPRSNSTSNLDSRPEPPQRSRTCPLERNTLPYITETPPQTENHNQYQPKSEKASKPLIVFPGRFSSQSQQPITQSKNPTIDTNISSKHLTTSNSSPSQANAGPLSTINGISQNRPPLPGSSVSTDALTIIPTLEVKKIDRKSKKDKDDSDSHSSRKPTWNWFKGGDEKEKKERRKEDEREGKRSKKSLMEKSHDNARLDVLQSTLDSGVTSGRESIMLDRESLDSRNLDEKKKESRKFSSGGEKREKDSLFLSIFGGGKRKGDRDASGKKGNSLRTLSPEPPPRNLKPDVDYNWTRFSILEERTIYRMAHLKLANPRRALYSQVLLSNFMYSYLAKVQQMHPHLQIPQSAIQKKQEMERRQKEQEQQTINQATDNDQYRYDYHEGIAQYAEGGSHPNDKIERSNYVDDSQIYDYDHPEGNSSYGSSSSRPQSRASQHTTTENSYENESQIGRQGYEYYQYTDQSNNQDEDEMW